MSARYQQLPVKILMRQTPLSLTLLDHLAGRKIPHNAHPPPYNTVFSNFDIFPCHCITAKERAGAYFGAPVDNSSCCNVTVIFNDGIMFYKGFSIDDAILANFCACIDQGMMHDDGALGNLGMRGDVSKG